MKKHLMLTIALAAAGASLLTACGGNDVEVSDVWARASAKVQKAGAVYMTIESASDNQLTGASVPAEIAMRAELHETAIAGGGATEAGATGESGSMEESGAMDEAGKNGASGESIGGDQGGDTASDEAAAKMMTMKQVAAIELPAGEAVQLKPGGFHIMLMGLKRPLAEGQKIEVTLEFEQAGTKTVTATVRK